MVDIVTNVILTLLVLLIFFYARRGNNKKEAEIRKLIQREIDSNDRLTAAMDRNTKAIQNGDLRWMKFDEISKAELIDLLKDAWIADQANQSFTTPFIEWLVREVSHA